MKTKKIYFKNLNDNETSIAVALKSAVQNLSKKKQTEIIAKHIYAKYLVFKKFKPLSLGIDKDLIQNLKQYDPKLVLRVLANHCKNPKYLKSLSLGGKRFNLNYKIQGEVTVKEQQIAKNYFNLKLNDKSKNNSI